MLFLLGWSADSRRVRGEVRERVGMGCKAGNGEVQHGKESGEGWIGWEDVVGGGGLRGYGWSDCI
jgi:hypothetical protein